MNDPRIEALARWLVNNTQNVLYVFDGLCSAPGCKNQAAYMLANHYESRIDQVKFICLGCAKDMKTLIDTRQIQYRDSIEKKVMDPYG